MHAKRTQFTRYFSRVTKAQDTLVFCHQTTRMNGACIRSFLACLSVCQHFLRFTLTPVSKLSMYPLLPNSTCHCTQPTVRSFTFTFSTWFPVLVIVKCLVIACVARQQVRPTDVFTTLASYFNAECDTAYRNLLNLRDVIQKFDPILQNIASNQCICYVLARSANLCNLCFKLAML